MYDKFVIVWCEINEESVLFVDMIFGVKEVCGDMKLEEKEVLLLGFVDGDFCVIVIKFKLVGFGVNWQYCVYVVFVFISFSYEQYYQVVCWFYCFGQIECVWNDIVISDIEKIIWDVINVKGKKYEEMKCWMFEVMIKVQFSV